MRLKVECYAGHRGEETPRLLVMGDRTVEVAEVLERWAGPDHRFFQVKGVDQATYILRYDTVRDCWELTMYERAGARP